MNKQVLCLNVKFVQLVDNTDSYKIRLRVRILKGKDGKMEFLIVTGLSGAGKSVTINALVDFIVWIISHQSLWLPFMICVSVPKKIFHVLRL